MAVVKETSIHRYIGDTADTKPTSVPVGTTFLDRQTGILYVTYDGTNYTAWTKIVKLGANSGVDIGDVDVTSIAAGDNNIGNVDLVTLPAANLGQRAMAASLSVVPASDVADGTYAGDIKFGEALPAGTADIGIVNIKRVQMAVATLTIAESGTTTGEFDARGYAMFGIVIPAAFTGASISFTVSDATGGTFQALYDTSNALVSVPVTQGRSYDAPAELAAWAFWKIVSSGAEAAARSIKIVAKG